MKILDHLECNRREILSPPFRYSVRMWSLFRRCHHGNLRLIGSRYQILVHQRPTMENVFMDMELMLKLVAVPGTQMDRDLRAVNLTPSREQLSRTETLQAQILTVK